MADNKDSKRADPKMPLIRSTLRTSLIVNFLVIHFLVSIRTFVQWIAVLSPKRPEKVSHG